MKDIVKDLPPLFEAFYSDEKARTCKNCGTVHPGKTPPEIVKQIKEDPQLKSVPVMLLTNYPEYQQMAVKAGAEEGFGKLEYGKPETLEKLQGLAKVAVFSQELEPGEGDPYDTILAGLSENPAMDAAAFGRLIVDRYDASYAGVEQRAGDAVGSPQYRSTANVTLPSWCAP